MSDLIKREDAIKAMEQRLQRDAADFGGLMYWKRNTTFDTDSPQTENLFTDKDGDVWEWRGDAWYCISGDEQTEREGE